jgi:thiol-disulfide isomerase/thioredoxin
MHAAPRALPDLGFEDGRGARHHLADFHGRVVLLNLWATWCAPCRAEMPTLDRLQARLGGKNFEVVALSLDQDGAPVVKRFFDEIGVHTLAIYVDLEMKAESSLGVVGVPTTLLIDRQGREVARKLGPAAWDSPEVAGVIQQVIARPAR